MPDTILERAQTETAAVFTADLLKMARALTIAEIEKFYRAAEPIAFEVTDAR
jgi:hypothetical protein